MLPIDKSITNDTIKRLGIVDLRSATIRQICALANQLEQHSGEQFSHLEIGNPGLPPATIGMQSERDAITEGIVNRYPNIAGIPEIKSAGSSFVKAFLDLDIDSKGIIPTVGSMQGTFTLMLLLKKRTEGKETMLFIHPGFPAQSNQAKILGMNTRSFDIYEYRGEKLRVKLEEMLAPGDVCGIIYSNPNNPAWTNFTDDELKIIGEMATKYDVIVLEDLAYMGMDFRKGYGIPYKTPYIPSVGKYTDNYILLISASKIFSYAGQRIAIVCISDKVYNSFSESIADFYEFPCFGDAYVYGVLYASSSGTAHSAQYAMASMMKAACEGRINFVADCSEYARRAKRVREIFLKNGFHLVYSDDMNDPISDGFFFTAGYGNLKSEILQLELLRYGIATISLPCTGSTQDGVRVCISVISDENEFSILDERLKRFDDDHKFDKSS